MDLSRLGARCSTGSPPDSQYLKRWTGGLPALYLSIKLGMGSRGRPPSKHLTRAIHGLCLLGWDHRECQERTLRVPWWAARALERAIQEAF